MSTLEHDLTQARKRLSDLQAELPDYHGLRADSDAEAARLKEANAPLDKQAQARVKARVAQDMLAEHMAEIAAVTGELSALAAEESRQKLLAKMAADAEDAKKHRLAMNAAFEKAKAALEEASETLFDEWRAEYQARRSFAETGNQIAPGFSSISNPPWAGLPHEEVEPFRARVNAVMNDLRERGAPLDFAADGATGRHHCFDEYARQELPREHLDLVVWQALLLLQGREAGILERYVPKPKTPIRLY